MNSLEIAVQQIKARKERDLTSDEVREILGEWYIISVTGKYGEMSFRPMHIGYCVRWDSDTRLPAGFIKGRFESKDAALALSLALSALVN